MKDTYYPESESIRMMYPGAYIGLLSKIEGHLAAAKCGDRTRESKLVNRLGQIRRMHPESFASIPEGLKDHMRAACEWLRANGRVTDFKNPDARYWISRRGGGPRW